MKTREIKFKIWTGSMMLQPKPLLIMYQETISGLTVGQWESQIYMQFTGLLDRLGKEIYEGDVLKFYYGSLSTGGASSWEVIYNAQLAMFRTRLIGGDKHQKGFSDGMMEIIGNVHSDPELLK